MIVHGVGSLNSPIVISDDEDEAYVELELEQRLSSPQEGMALDFEDDYQPDYDWHAPPSEEREFAREERLPESVIQDATPDEHDHGTPGSSLAGQKRKRGSTLDSPDQRLHPLPGQTQMAQPRPPSPGAYPGESKAARKKRRKRERQAAESMAHPLAGPSTGVMHPLQAMPAMHPPSMSPVSSLMPQMPSLLPFPLHASLPPKPMMFPDFGFPLPPISLQDLHIAAAMSMFPVPPTIPQPVPPPFVNMHPMPLPPVDLSVVMPNEPPPPASDEPEPVRKAPIVKKPIGVPPDPDPSSLHGTYKSPNPNFAPPNPARTLVMELSPKKFRNVAFVRSWAMTFGTRPIKPPRIDLDVKAGKALIEFPTAEVARLAFESDRMLGEGREHIRVFWYRVRGVGADAGVGELEEGEIEDGELAKHHGKLKQKAKDSKKAVESTSFVTLPVVDPPLSAKRAAEQPRPPPLVIPPLPSTSNVRRTSVSQSPVALATPARSPIVSTNGPRQSTLPPLPASLPAKPVLRQPPAKPSGPPPSQPPPLLSRIQQPDTESRPEFFAVSISQAPTPPSSLDANAPVFVPKALSLSSTPAPVDSARPPLPSSLDIPGLRVGLEAVGASEADGVQTGSKRTVAERDGATPEPVRNVIAQAIFGLQQRPEKDEASSVASPRGHSPPQDLSELPIASLQPPLERNDIPAATRPPPIPTQSASSLLPAESVLTLDSIITSSEIAVPGTPSTMLCAPAPVRDLSHSPFSTPTPPPSEPRAVRNLPKHPSYAKRREVEESIAKHRELMASQSSASSSGSTTPVSEVEAMIVSKSSSPLEEMTPSPTLPPSAEITTAMREDDLRRLVLNSRKSRASSTTPGTPPVASPPPTFVASVTLSEVSTMGDTKARLDELAVSFITQSIQAARLPSPPTPTHATPPASEKARLAAKQRALEANIADQKALMRQYAAARTKAERAALRDAMAARSRAMEQELAALAAARAPRFRWPDTDRAACVLVISDDEGEA